MDHLHHISIMCQSTLNNKLETKLLNLFRNSNSRCNRQHFRCFNDFNGTYNGIEKPTLLLKSFFSLLNKFLDCFDNRKIPINELSMGCYLYPQILIYWSLVHHYKYFIMEHFHSFNDQIISNIFFVHFMMLRKMASSLCRLLMYWRNSK